MSKKRILYSFMFFLIALGVILEPSFSLFKNLIILVQGRDALVTDYFAKASIGAAFVNAGIVGLIATIILDKIDGHFSGTDFGSIMFIAAFALFGKNFLNIWPIIIGGLIYPYLFKEDLKVTISRTFYATSLAPLISDILFHLNINSYLRIPIALITGISIGILVNLISPHVRNIHKEYSLYNTGFVVGIIGTVYVSLFRSYGFDIQSEKLWDLNKNSKLYIIFTILFLSMTVYGIYKDKGLKSYFNLLRMPGKQQDYFKKFEISTILINGGTLGLFSLLVVYLLNAPLNGPILGGIIGIVGFMGSGKHVKNIAPIFIGVILASFNSIWSASDPSIILIMLFLSGLAPITYEFGFMAAVVAAFINVTVTRNIGSIYGGMNLYNTGFSIGLTCAFIVPVYERCIKTKSLK